MVWQCNDIRITWAEGPNGITYDVSGSIWGGSQFFFRYDGVLFFNGRSFHSQPSPPQKRLTVVRIPPAILGLVRADLYRQKGTLIWESHVLLHHRRHRLYDIQQRERVWREHAQPPASAVAVGVMGLGVLGAAAAFALARLGFRVAGWSRTPKTLAGIECFHGEAGLEAFLRSTEILVCLLPATPATQGILDLKLLRQLKRDGAAGGAHLINAARGMLQVEADILAALDEGALAGATLDVFAREPLPAPSPLWRHPKVTITPHNAAFSDPRALAANVLRQIERFEKGLPLAHVIDRARGY
jgi:glyoxylate/hydroxypyruvate reductase A